MQTSGADGFGADAPARKATTTAVAIEHLPKIIRRQESGLSSDPKLDSRLPQHEFDSEFCATEKYQKLSCVHGYTPAQCVCTEGFDIGRWFLSCPLEGYEACAFVNCLDEEWHGRARSVITKLAEDNFLFSAYPAQVPTIFIVPGRPCYTLPHTLQPCRPIARMTVQPAVWRLMIVNIGIILLVWTPPPESSVKNQMDEEPSEDEEEDDDDEEEEWSNEEEEDDDSNGDDDGGGDEKPTVSGKKRPHRDDVAGPSNKNNNKKKD
ncbi:unnamed protein product [Triticum turgidum subsp. durum]|uniref:Uncharacterized protein n=1 Tax=Triticum turgidum subsp. durum TaxID=4567 RepID=A0A9R1QH70_TRITD|nr:unnamed protein product [Triticum turgidum subsp. durum]